MRLVLDLAGKAADQLQGRVGLGAHQVGEGAAEDGGRDLREHAQNLAGGLGLLPVVDLLLGAEQRDVVAPDPGDLVPLGQFGRLFGRQEGGDLLPKPFVGDLVQVGAVRKVGLGEVTEAAGQQDAPRGEATGGILAAETFGAPREALGDPEALVGRDDLAEHLADLAEFEVAQLSRRGVGEGEDVLDAHAALRPLGEVRQDLVVDTAAEFRRQRGELGADLRPVAEAEGGKEAGVGGRARVGLGRLLHRGEDFGEVAGVAMTEQALVLLLRLGVEHGLLGGQGRGEHEGGAEERTEESHDVVFGKGFRNRCRGSS